MKSELTMSGVPLVLLEGLIGYPIARRMLCRRSRSDRINTAVGGGETFV